MKKKISICVALIAGALASTAVAPAVAATVKVTAGDVDAGSWFTADTRPGASWAFEAGPATPPLGSGSLELTTPLGSAKVQMLTDAYVGTRLADVDGIGYSTYRDPASTGFVAGLPSLNLRVDLDGGGSPDVYMVYEPYQDQGNAAVLTGVWQNWDAHAAGDAEWWINTGAGGCPQATPCTWDEILTAFPDATIREGADFPGSLGVNQGSGNPGLVTNADALRVSVAGQATTYDFDPAVGPPVAKDECKRGGWQRFDAPRQFRNQGDCVSFVASGR